MKIIPAITDDNGTRPSEPAPEDTIMIVGSPDGYVCYQTGDELPVK